ncbi:hypothetical protein NPX13_g4087 [Xylaria arbuscula]|uniref:Dynein light chain n=1 Tax=Xylaria arbuscula TaxID=114810 RepID=A0A9W8NGP0_9PEZI|nr:hypothetical protein NPX13_g4087 [Xylaria arbuscula]
MTEQASPPPATREKLDAQIKSADMTEDMQQEAIDVAQEAMGKFTIEKDIAQHIKKTVEKALHGTVLWEGTSEALSLMRQSTSSISTLAIVPFCSSRHSSRLAATTRVAKAV